MKQWNTLARSFSFDSIGYEPGRFYFEYSTDSGHRFTHEFTHSFPPDANLGSLKPALLALGMTELSHYWKAILAPEIIVRAGKLEPDQVRFWENLYTKGLGEFFFVNEIDFRGLVNVRSADDAPVVAPIARKQEPKAQVLVPFGGGKDSLVTGEFLKKQGKSFSWFELEKTMVAEKLQKISGVTDSVRIGRDVFKNFGPIIELVKLGAPNGHVPITSTYMFSAVLAAIAHGFQDIVMSVERSASFGNVEYLGEVINHQYSKSFEFERMAREYIRTYIDPGIRIFSILRPLYEIQIVKEFVKYPQYFPYFMSCNRGLKTGGWGGDCAKCAFIFVSLSAFLPPSEVKKIFKMNLFENEQLLPLYRDLAGLGAMKPFDCVGTFDENLLALFLSGEQYRKAGLSLPKVLVELPIERGKPLLHLLNEQSNEHFIPADYRLA